MIPLKDMELIPSEIMVIRELHKSKQASRAELCKLTQLSPQSLTRLTKKLIDNGLIVEGDKRTKQRGQPAISLSIAASKFVSFGIAIEYDKVTCSIYALDGEQLFFLKNNGDYSIAKSAIEVANNLLQVAISQCPEQAVALGVGVSVSGFFKKQNGLRLISRTDMEGWLDVDLITFLTPSTNLPVFVENDGSTSALGQLVSGMGGEFESFFQVLMTQGIGGGFIQNGQLVRGFNGNAGEVSHFFPLTETRQRLYRPTEEGLNKFCQERWGNTPSDEELESMIMAGEKDLDEWITNAAIYLKQGLDAIIAILDPEAIILAGRLPYSIRLALSKKIMLEGLYYGNEYGPKPNLLVDPAKTDLSNSSALLPVAYQLYNL